MTGTRRVLFLGLACVTTTLGCDNQLIDQLLEGHGPLSPPAPGGYDAGAGDAKGSQRCGGNTANTRECPAGFDCVPDPATSLPFGDVGGVCVKAPAPPVCGPVCQIFCEYGHVLDANGCPTCGCNPVPPVPKPCPPEQCAGPAPKSPSFICPDGHTVGGPACVANAMGVCGWAILTCPAPAR